MFNINKILNLICIVYLLVGMSSCSIWEGYGPVEEPPEIIEGIAPVYFEEANRFFQRPARSIINSVGIVSFKSKLFILDEFIGIHIIDNSDSTNPTGITFLEIVGLRSFTLDNQYLYANQVGDLVTFDIRDLKNVKIESVQTDVFDHNSLQLPLNYRGYFECPDDNKGKVVSWNTKNLNKPECLIR